MSSLLSSLDKTLADRKQADPSSSYVASLHAKGVDAILAKVNEESTELVVAAKSEGLDAVIHETADLWFHTLVLLSHLGLSSDDVLTELAGRQGQSGLEEKAKRK